MNLAVTFSEETSTTFSSGFSDFSVLQGPPGPKGDPGTPGADGKTPVKGVDYYTEADKSEMVSAVISALPVYDGSVTSV